MADEEAGLTGVRLLDTTGVVGCSIVGVIGEMGNAMSVPDLSTRARAGRGRLGGSALAGAANAKSGATGPAACVGALVGGTELASAV